VDATTGAVHAPAIQATATMTLGLTISACTPGFIETDLTRPYAAASGRSPAEMGMKQPAAGTRSTMALLFDVEGSGRYCGSDGLRSPLDRYRSPGSPAYAGD